MEQNSCILVTGAGGVLGTGLLVALKEAGYANVLAPSRKELNLLDREGVSAYFEKNNPSYVFHLASVVYGLKGNDINQWRSLTENTEINQNLFSAISKRKVKKVFFASTVAAYPNGTSIPLKEEKFFSGLPHFGEFGYAMSKRHAYAYLTLLKKKQGIPFCYGVFTNIYGKNDRFNPETGHVIPSLIHKAYLANNKGEKLEVWGNPTTTRDFIYGDDAGCAALFAMNNLEGIVNISCGEEISMDRVANAIVSNFNGLQYSWNNSMPVGISKRWVCNEKLKNAGWKPRFSFDEGIKNTIEWYKENTKTIRQ